MEWFHCLLQHVSSEEQGGLWDLGHEEPVWVGGCYHEGQGGGGCGKIARRIEAWNYCCGHKLNKAGHVVPYFLAGMFCAAYFATMISSGIYSTFIFCTDFQ